MSEIHVVIAYLQAARTTLLSADNHGRERDEAGLGIVETVILTAVFAAAAIAIGTIIVTKFTGKASSIPTGP